MITDSEKWHICFIRRNNSNNNGDYYCINFLHSFRRENNLKAQETVCKGCDYCYIEIPEKSMRVPFVIYAERESLLEKK